MRKKFFISVCLCGLLWFSACELQEPEPQPGQGKLYYVAPGGNDGNNGSRNSPWKSVQYALGRLEAGDTLTIMEGTYRESLYLSKSATAEKKIQIKGEKLATTILDGVTATRDLFFIEKSAYIEISNLTFTRAPRAGLRLSYAHNVTVYNCVFAYNGRWGIFTDFSNRSSIRNNEIYGSVTEHGVYISNSSDNATVSNNVIHHNYAAGIQFNADPSAGGDGISSDCVIENNVIYENGYAGGAAINVASVRNSTIQNNMIYDNYAGGIACWDDNQGPSWGCKDLTIIHNTVFFQSQQGRWALSLRNGSTGCNIYNNILAGGARGGLEFSENSLPGLRSDGNVFHRNNSPLVISDDKARTYTLLNWQTAGYDPKSISETPQNIFKNIFSGDLHLKDICRAKDLGVNRNLLYDYEGDVRPRGNGPDAGADETKQ